MTKLVTKRQIVWQAIKHSLADMFSISTGSNVTHISSAETNNGKKSKEQ